MLSVIAAVDQAEREGMRERQRDGIAKAKREGRYKGRVPTARRQAAEVARLTDAGISPTEIAVRLGSVGRASIGCCASRQSVIGWRREQLSWSASLARLQCVQPLAERSGDSPLSCPPLHRASVYQRAQ